MRVGALRVSALALCALFASCVIPEPVAVAPTARPTPLVALPVGPSPVAAPATPVRLATPAPVIVAAPAPMEPVAPPLPGGRCARSKNGGPWDCY
jgi:hypothetical protein